MVSEWLREIYRWGPLENIKDLKGSYHSIELHGLSVDIGIMISTDTFPVVPVIYFTHPICSDVDRAINRHDLGWRVSQNDPLRPDKLNR